MSCFQTEILLRTCIDMATVLDWQLYWIGKLISRVHPNSVLVHKLVRAECVRCPWLLSETKMATISGKLLVRAECVRCPWLLAETKVATILGTLVRAKCVRQQLR
jgi:hypothetical protein